MAEFIKNIPTNLTEYPNSFKRQGAFPLEAYSVFATLDAAKNYAQTNAIAYIGQTLAVCNEAVGTPDTEGYIAATATLYVIEDAAGNLKEVGTKPVGDDKTISVSEAGVVSVKIAGEIEADKEYYLTPGANGTLEWKAFDHSRIDAIEDILAGFGKDEGEVETVADALLEKVDQITVTHTDTENNTEEGVTYFIEDDGVTKTANIVIDAYTKQETKAEIERQIQSVTGGESAADVKLSLENYRDAVNTEIWGAGAASWTTTETDENGKPYVKYTPDYSATSRIDSLEDNVEHLLNWEQEFVDKDTTYSVAEDEKILKLDGTTFSTVASLKYIERTADSNAKIQLLGIDNAVVSEIDASDFVIDGMLANVTKDTATNEIIFTWNTDAGEVVTKIDIDELVEVYTAGNGIDITNYSVSVKKDSASEDFFYVNENGVGVNGIEAAITDALEAAQKYADLNDANTTYTFVKDTEKTFLVTPHDGDTTGTPTTIEFDFYTTEEANDTFKTKQTAYDSDNVNYDNLTADTFITRVTQNENGEVEVERAAVDFGNLNRDAYYVVNVGAGNGIDVKTDNTDAQNPVVSIKIDETDSKGNVVLSATENGLAANIDLSTYELTDTTYTFEDGTEEGTIIVTEEGKNPQTVTVGGQKVSDAKLELIGAKTDGVDADTIWGAKNYAANVNRQELNNINDKLTLGTYVDGDESKEYATVKAYVEAVAEEIEAKIPTGTLASKNEVTEDLLAGELATKINSIENAATTAAKKYTDEEIQKLDYADLEDVSGKYVSKVEQVDGKITVTHENLPTYTLASGETNGTVKFNGSEVAVKGLGSAAYTDSTAYDAKDTAKNLIEALDVEDTAVSGQYVSSVSEVDGKIVVSREALPVDTLVSGTALGTVKFNGTDVAVTGLGGAAYKAEDYYDVKDTAKNLIEALDVTDVAVSGEYVSSVSQVDGKIVVNRTALPAQTDYSVTVETTLPEDADHEGIAKHYVFKQLGNPIAHIDIPKELVVSAGSVVIAGDADVAADASVVAGEKYIKLVLNNDDIIYIPVKDLVDVYTADNSNIPEYDNGPAGVQINISDDNKISAELVGVANDIVEAVATSVSPSGVVDALNNLDQTLSEAIYGISSGDTLIKVDAEDKTNVVLTHKKFTTSNVESIGEYVLTGVRTYYEEEDEEGGVTSYDSFIDVKVVCKGNGIGDIYVRTDTSTNELRVTYPTLYSEHVTDEPYWQTESDSYYRDVSTEWTLVLSDVLVNPEVSIHPVESSNVSIEGHRDNNRIWEISFGDNVIDSIKNYTGDYDEYTFTADTSSFVTGVRVVDGHVTSIESSKFENTDIVRSRIFQDAANQLKDKVSYGDDEYEYARLYANLDEELATRFNAVGENGLLEVEQPGGEIYPWYNQNIIKHKEFDVLDKKTVTQTKDGVTIKSTYWMVADEHSNGGREERDYTIDAPIGIKSLKLGDEWGEDIFEETFSGNDTHITGTFSDPDHNTKGYLIVTLVDGTEIDFGNFAYVSRNDETPYVVTGYSEEYGHLTSVTNTSIADILAGMNFIICGGNASNS